MSSINPYPIIPPGIGTTQVGIMYPYGSSDAWTDNMYRGCSSRYAISNSNVYDTTDGIAYPVPDNGTDGITVEKGHTVEYEVFPASGFKVHTFYDFYDRNLTYQPIRSGTAYIKTNIQDTLVVCPNFMPANPTYNRTITVNVSGVDLFNAVKITSMLGYYEYNVGSSVSGVQVVFNRYGLSQGIRPYDFDQNILPDGKTLYINVKKRTGYTAKLFVDGVEQTPIGDGRPVEYEVTGVDQVNQIAYSNSPDDQDTTESEQYTAYRVSNNSANKCTIGVVYYLNLDPETYRVEVSSNGGGTVQVYDEANGGLGSNSSRIDVVGGHNVVIKATPNENYSFLMWKEANTGFTTSEPTYTWQNVQQNLSFVANFTRSSTTISVRQDPPSGSYGTAKIRVDGNILEQSTINSADYGSADRIELVAAPAASTSQVEYRFVRWSCTTVGERSSQSVIPQYDATNPTISVSFDSVNDLVFTAHFAAVSGGIVNFNGHTVSGTNGSFTDGPSQPLFLGVKYQNQSGVPVSVQLDAEGETFSAKLTNYGGTLSTTLLLSHTGNDEGDYIYTDGTTGRSYLCHFEGFYYREIFSLYQGQNWVRIYPVDGAWTWSIDESASIDRIPTIEIAAAYTVKPMYSVKITAENDSGVSLPSNYINFTVEKNHLAYAGDIFVTGDNVGITAEAAGGVYQYFTFVKWLQDGEVLSVGDPHCSITIGDSDTVITAVFHQKCQVSVVASPSNAGTVDVNGQQGTALIDYGGAAVLTAVAGPGYTFNGWWKDGSEPNGSSTPYTIYPVTNISPVTYTAKFIQSSKKLRVMDSEGGTVQIDTQESGSSEWSVPVPDTTGSSYREYTIETGSRIRATAVPEQSYTFDKYVLYDTQDQHNQVENSSRVFVIDNLDVDKTLVPSFRHIPWISTLSSIIKVF